MGNEVEIRQHSEEAGVLYATEKITIDIGELQSRLGILELRQEAGLENTLKSEQSSAIQEENWRRAEAGKILKAQSATRFDCSQGAAMAFKAKVGAEDAEDADAAIEGR